MANVFETSGAKPQLASGLAEGVNTISGNETVTFTLYKKLVLPLDGYVFWVNATLLTDSALYNASQYNRLLYNNYPEGVPARQIKVKGSFHHNSNVQMLEDRQTVFNHTIFTALEEIADFNLINPQFTYIANYQGMRFAFNSRDNFYKQADLYHYRGDALYSVMTTQIIDSMTGFDTQSVIVSNSLPIWLALNQFFPMYPSYLVDQNIVPPYAAVDITPQDTTALGQFPIVSNIAPTIGSGSAIAGYAIAGDAIAGKAIISTTSAINQLAHDKVKITIYGIRNNEALNFVNYVLQYSLNTDNIGIMNMPIIQDEKMTQSELGIMAQKKSITFEVSYYQNTVNNIALQLIYSAFMRVTPTIV